MGLAVKWESRHLASTNLKYCWDGDPLGEQGHGDVLDGTFEDRVRLLHGWDLEAILDTQLQMDIDREEREVEGLKICPQVSRTPLDSHGIVAMEVRGIEKDGMGIPTVAGTRRHDHSGLDGWSAQESLSSHEFVTISSQPHNQSHFSLKLKSRTGL